LALPSEALSTIGYIRFGGYAVGSRSGSPSLPCRQSCPSWARYSTCPARQFAQWRAELARTAARKSWTSAVQKYRLELQTAFLKTQKSRHETKTGSPNSSLLTRVLRLC